MNTKFCHVLVSLLFAVACFPIQSHAQTPAERVVLTRIFFQDDDAHAIRWADLYAGTPPTLGSVQSVEGFPTLDAEAQSLVQMAVARNMLLVGVRDAENGERQSGWVLIDTGVDSEDHDGHWHSTYARQPKVRATQLDARQGNPAHLYVYDEVFYLANDKLSGYTRLDPKSIHPSDNAAAIGKRAEFVPGGGGHITLAVADKSVGYATWIDREGDHRGRIDITLLAERKIKYSLQLPHGGLHGATFNSGKVFFAPSAGIYWTPADLTGTLSPSQVKLQHISLGKDGADDKPLRTGAFQNFGKRVFCVTGQGEHAALQWLDASQPQPEVRRLGLDFSEGSRPVGPVCGFGAGNWPCGLIFADREGADDGEERVVIVEFDPNGDGDFRDARIAQSLPIGKSRIDGHAGHHDAVFVSDRRHAVLSNPGSGTLQLLRLRRREVVGEFKVGGAPSKLEAVGNPSGH